MEVKSKGKISIIVAHIVSIVFHPLLTNIYGIFLLFAYTNLGVFYQGQISKFIFPVFLFSCLMPLVGMLILKSGGYISSFSLDKQDERGLPFFIAFVSYLCQYYYFYQSMVPQWFLNVLLIPLILSLICYLFNRFFKISIHMVSMGALVGASMSISYNISLINPFWLFIILFICTGIVGTSRLLLKKHNSYEVYFGFLVGYSISYLIVLLSVFFYIIFSSK